jgi:hypothetical protein
MLTYKGKTCRITCSLWTSRWVYEASELTNKTMLTYQGKTCHKACSSWASRWCEASGRGAAGRSCARRWWGTARTGTGAYLLDM